MPLRQRSNYLAFEGKRYTRYEKALFHETLQHSVFFILANTCFSENFFHLFLDYIFWLPIWKLNLNKHFSYKISGASWLVTHLEAVSLIFYDFKGTYYRLANKAFPVKAFFRVLWTVVVWRNYSDSPVS